MVNTFISNRVLQGWYTNGTVGKMAQSVGKDLLTGVIEIDTGGMWAVAGRLTKFKCSIITTHYYPGAGCNAHT